MVAGSKISVVAGDNGRLFLEGVGDSNKYLAEARDLTRWRRDILPKHIANYMARHERMKERGLPFVIVFAPEASGIYTEDLPADFQIERPTACEILADELRKRGANVVCPADAMRRAKAPVDVCLKLDSHWSPFGAYIGYREIMGALPTQFAQNAVPWQEILYSHNIGYGDLGVHAVPERKGQIQEFDIPYRAVDAGKNIFDLREKNLRRSSCAEGYGKALIYRDSFTNALAPFFERTFAETILVAPAPTMIDSAVDYFQPDCVILEVAERALFVIEYAFADWPARTFAQEYLELAENPAGGRRQVQALQAMTEGKFDDAIIFSILAIAKEGKVERIHNLAMTLYLQQRYDLCLELLGSHERVFEDSFLCYLYADSLSYLGKKAEAVVMIDKALAVHPTNPVFLFLKGDWLAQLQDLEGGLDALQKSIRYAPLHHRGWTRTIELLEAMQRDEEAGRMRGELSVIYPD